MVDVIVIGAGYGGMTCAALLSNAGKKTLLIEAARTVGGRAASYRDEAGFTWEYGAHSHRLSYKGIANEAFKRLGEEIEFLPESSDAKLIFRGKLWDRPAGLKGFLQTPMLPLSARIALVILLAKLKKADPCKWYDKTLLDFYRTSLPSSALEEFLPFFGMTIMCPSLGRVSAGEVIEFLQRALKAGVGVGEPRGGSAQIFAKLQKHIAKNGAVRLGEKVTAINIENGLVQGVSTDQGKYAANKVVFAARLPLLLEVLDPALLEPSLVNYAKNLENSSGLTIDFITDRQIGNIRSSIIGVDIPVWARFQSNADDSFTPTGKYLSTWGIMLPWHFNGDPAAVAAAEKCLKDTISLLFPDFLPNVIKERKLVIPIMNGNILTPAQSKPHRPSVTCKTIGGLYFVGDTVHGAGCSGDISFSSAMQAADMILQK